MTLQPLHDDERFRLHTVADVLAFPEPKWQIEGLFSERSFVLVWAPTSVGKTFLLLDWALSLSTGTPWLGRRVQKARVVFIAAEGGGQLGSRLAAWMCEHGIESVSDLKILDSAVQLVNETPRLVTAIEDFRPDVVVIDPFTDCSVGLDENAAKDQRLFIDAVRKIQQLSWQPTVVLSHHTGWETKHERGSTTLRSAADVVLSLNTPRAGPLLLATVKQRDSDKAADIPLYLTPVSVDLLGRHYQSCVFRGADPPSADASAELNVGQRTALQALASRGVDGASTHEWQQAAEMKERTLHAHRGALVKYGLVKRVAKGVFRVTEAGKRRATATAS